MQRVSLFLWSLLLTFFSVGAVATTLQEATDQLFARVKNVGQLRVVARAIYGNDDDRKYIDEVVAKVDPSTSILFSKKEGSVATFKVESATITVDIGKADKGIYRINGHNVQMKAKTLREWAEAIRKVSEAKQAGLGFPLTLPLGIDQAHAFFLAPLALYGLLAFAVGAIYTGWKCWARGYDMQQYVKNPTPWRDGFGCAGAALGWPATLLRWRGSNWFAKKDDYFTSAHVVCQDATHPETKVYSKFADGREEQIVIKLKDGKPSRAIVSEYDPDKSRTNMLGERELQPDWGTTGSNFWEGSPTDLVNSSHYESGPNPAMFSQGSAQTLRSVVDQCAKDPKDISTFEDLLNLKDVKTSTPEPPRSQ